MRIYPVCFESAHADPAKMCTAFTRHVVATIHFLYPGFAFRAFFHSLSHGPLLVESFLLDRIVEDFPLIACHSLMGISMTKSAYTRETRWAMLEAFRAFATIYLGAIRRRAIFEILQVFLYMSHERRLDQTVELRMWQELLDRRNRDWALALCVVSDARQRKYPGITCGG